jgi:hypothetical protein
MSNTYVIHFRGERIETFKSVHDSVHLVLTHKRPEDWVTGKLGNPAMLPSVVSWYLTARSAIKRITEDPTHLATYPHQSYVIKAYPGPVEITDAEVVYQ